MEKRPCFVVPNKDLHSAPIACRRDLKQAPQSFLRRIFGVYADNNPDCGAAFKRGDHPCLKMKQAGCADPRGGDLDVSDSLVLEFFSKRWSERGQARLRKQLHVGSPFVVTFLGNATLFKEPTSTKISD
jgi:hypothetical protein